MFKIKKIAFFWVDNLTSAAPRYTFTQNFLGVFRLRLVLILSFLLSFQVFGKTYVIPSDQIGCDEILEVVSVGALSRYEKYLTVSFVGSNEEKVFSLKSINRYYDSVWLDYFSQDGEKLEYFWDDGYGIDEGFRFRKCLYVIR